jgi:hypothetical protein
VVESAGRGLFEHARKSRGNLRIAPAPEPPVHLAREFGRGQPLRKPEAQNMFGLIHYITIVSAMASDSARFLHDRLTDFGQVGHAF